MKVGYAINFSKMLGYLFSFEVILQTNWKKLTRIMTKFCRTIKTLSVQNDIVE